MWSAENAEAAARAVLPGEVYDYFAGGSGAEATLAANVSAWERLRLRPRVLRDVAAVETSTTVLGTAVRAPVLVAPTAFHRLAHPDGEAATAAGTAAAGGLFVVSTRSSVPFERVGAAPWWLQVYLLRDRGLTADLVARAVAAGARALVLTGDTPYVGRKRRTDRDLVIAERDLLANVPAVADVSRVEQSPAAGFGDIGWLRDVSGLPVLVKGVLRGDDARACLAEGAAGIVVSNHGGRQLDGAIATADALPEVADAVAGECEVYVDGGIRRGVDVLRALAAGARAVLIGRPVLWGLAAGGGDGVRAVLDGLATDFAHAMALAGAATCAEVSADLVAGHGGPT